LGPDSARGVEEHIGRMGRERIALRTRNFTVVLLSLCSFSCLFLALTSLAGYAPNVVPRAVGPSAILLFVSAVGFALSVLEGRNPS